MTTDNELIETGTPRFGVDSYRSFKQQPNLQAARSSLRRLSWARCQ